MTNWPKDGSAESIVIWIITDLENGDPYGTRTRVFAVRGRRPGPLDEGAMLLSGGRHMWTDHRLVNSRRGAHGTPSQSSSWSRSLRYRINSARVDSIWSCIC